MMKFDVIILAGAPNAGSLAKVSSATWEALVSVGNRPMVEYVADTALLLKNVGRIVLVGPKELQNSRSGIDFIPCKNSLIDNLKAGIDSLGKDRSPYSLVVTSDIPLISVEAIDDFVKQCALYDAKVFYPIVSKESNVSRYPQVERTYFTLRDGTYTGGNIILLDPDILDTHYALAKQLIELRKNPAKIIKILGVKFIYKYVTRALSIEQIEKRAEEILGFRGKAIISLFPEIGIDVDKPNDLLLMEEIFASTYSEINATSR